MNKALETKKKLRAMNLEEMEDLAQSMGEKSFRGRQLFHWIHHKGIQQLNDAVNLPQSFLQEISQVCQIGSLGLEREQVSQDKTRKYLFRLEDSLAIEAVLMNHLEKTGHIRHTLCVSTQVGCAMGCAFCATGQAGFTRNLAVDEILGQVYGVIALRRKEDPAFQMHNVVYMGMGEPLQNFEAVVKSIRLLNHPQGKGIGIRRMTLSTCGLPQQILRLAQEELDVVLALSLHAPNDTLRNQLMPVNLRYPLEKVMAACREYVRITGRRITIEYIMIDQCNVDSACAQELCGLLKGLSCNVNLIPVNDAAMGFKRPSVVAQNQFRKVLEDCGLEVVVRQEKGSDISGACGQLAGEHKQGE